MNLFEGIKKSWALITLAAVLVIIFAANISSTNFLMGWDNLMPEFNTILNIKRSLFSVWQESHGLGVLGGNAYSSDLPHQIAAFLLGIILPINLIRWIYTFTMLALGTFGSYFLIRSLLADKNGGQIPPLIGSLFYLLNLATIQNFFIPFEPFITFFGFLPLLLLSTINFVRSPGKKTFLIFLLVNLFSLPLAQVPTMFGVYLLTLASAAIGLYLENKKTFKPIIKLGLTTLFLNLFWLIPFFYFVATNSNVAFEAKINQMSTETVYQQNKEFGNITDVMLLKGFWFNNVDLTRSGYFEHMFDSWRGHLENPLISLIGYSFFFLALLGVFIAIRSRNKIYFGFVFLFITCLILLTIETPPFSYINSVLRDAPIFNQVFRSPFTKFSTVFSLTIALFLGLSTQTLLSFLSERKILAFLRNYAFGAILISLLFIYSFPIFQGNLFYERVKTNPPKDYFELFKYFQSQNPNTRIAIFPQYTFWGWNFYEWGYGGSGFLWFGLPQPTLDRLFDVWGRENENYYWEISQALYSRNSQAFTKVLNKYQANWLIVDKNVMPAAPQKILFVEELEEMIKDTPEIKKDKSFGNIDVYRLDLVDNPQNFVFIDKKLPKINGFRWGSDDVAYQSYGNYISGTNNSLNYFYPYRTLFSNKNLSDQEFKVRESEDSLDFVANLYNASPSTKITIPSFNQMENLLPVDIMQKKEIDGSVAISIAVRSPEVLIDDGSEVKIWEEKRENPIFNIPSDTTYPLNLSVNGILNFRIDSQEDSKTLGSTFFVNGEENTIILTDSSGVISSKIISTDSLEYESGHIEINLPYIKTSTKIIVRLGKIKDNYQGLSHTAESISKQDFKNCDLFRKGEFSKDLINVDEDKVLRFNSKNATACTSFYSPKLLHSEAYAILIRSANLEGRPLHFWVLNEDQDFAPIDIYLEKNKNLSDHFVILPPQEKFGLSYSFHFENPSVADRTINYLDRVAIYPIPYKFLTSIELSSGGFDLKADKEIAPKVSHPNESFYSVEIDSPLDKDKTLILSQSFDDGWKAYKMADSKGSLINDFLPFVFGKEINDHILVNNWENGWILHPADFGSKTKVTIVYLPQYLQLLGFILAISGIPAIFRKL